MNQKPAGDPRPADLGALTSLTPADIAEILLSASEKMGGSRDHGHSPLAADILRRWQSPTDEDTNAGQPAKPAFGHSFSATIGLRMNPPKQQAPAPVIPPAWALRFLGREHATHYMTEWSAHLWELAQDGDHNQARRDRRRMTLSVPWFAIQLRLSAAVNRVRARR